MKKMRFLLVLLVGISIVSCTNDLDEMLGTQNLQTHSQNCWIAINWADASTFESIIGW